MIMNAKVESSSAFFEAKYQQDLDPWNFSSDAYELGRYDAIIGAISHRRYHQAFEPGCSIGVLTERLAIHCEAVDAIDFSSTAAAQAQARCRYLPNVVVTCAGIPEIVMQSQKPRSAWFASGVGLLYLSVKLRNDAELDLYRNASIRFVPAEYCEHLESRSTKVVGVIAPRYVIASTRDHRRQVGS